MANPRLLVRRLTGPSNQVPIRETFERLAVDVWERLKAADDFGIPQSEETITDIVTLDLARAATQFFEVYKAVGDEEAEKGFDFELWIRNGGGGWWRYSIQAKKLSGTYQQLRYKVSHNRYQIDILKDFARSQGSIPLYVFYNHVSSQDAEAAWHCRLAIDGPQLGCSVVPLHIVRPFHEPYVRRTFRALHSTLSSLPWRCLVCCPYLVGSTESLDGWHPLAHPEIRPRNYESPPRFRTRRAAADGKYDSIFGRREGGDLLLEVDDEELYTSEYGGRPRVIAIIDPSRTE